MAALSATSIPKKIYHPETDKKQKLTEEQLVELCEAIPLNPNLPKQVRLSIIANIRTRLYNDLSTVEIYPCLFQKFKEEIVKYYYKSLAESGEAVGVQVAQSIGERQTQSTLNSIDWEDKVLVYNRGDKKMHIEPVGQYIDNLLDDEKSKKYIQHIPENRTEYLELENIGLKDVVMPSVDENGFTKWLKVEAVTRHLPVGKLVKVTTQLGRDVTATQAKSFLVWDENEQKLVGKNGSDIRVGDILATSSRNDRIGDETHLSLEQFFPKTVYLYTTDLNIAKRYRETDCGWWDDHQAKDYVLPYSRGDHVFSCRKENLEDGFVYLHRSVKFVSAIPDKIPLDNDFGFLVGIYLAEGCCTKTFTAISNKCPVIRKRVTDWCDRYGITYHLVETKAKQVAVDPNTVSVDLKLHSVLLTRLLTLMCNTGSDKKIVPLCAYTANEDFQRGLIDGYFSGDGTVDKESGTVSATSVSKDLITGISFILSYFGIFGRISSTQAKQNNIESQHIKRSYQIFISNSFVQRFAQLGLTKPDKNEKLQTITYFKSKFQDSFGIDNIDVMFDEIVSIEMVEPTKVNVYDFTIADTRNFLTFNCLANKDTFHSSGISIKTVVVGVPRFSELLNATKSPKMVNCLLFLNERFNEIGEVRKRAGHIFTDMTIRRLTQSTELIQDKPLDDWHYLFCDLYHINPSVLGWRLRLQIDRAMMCEYQVTMKMIAEAVMREYGDVIVLHTPEWIGLLDIFIDEATLTKLAAKQQKNSAETEKVEEEEQEDFDDGDDIVDDDELIDIPNVDDENEEDERDKNEKKKKLLELSVVSFSKNSKKEYKKDIVPEDIDRILYMEDFVQPTIMDIRVSGIQGIKDIFFEKRKNEWIITTEGSNLYQLFSNPLIDKVRSISNDMWEIYQIFGIEATRQFLIEEYMDIVRSDGSFVNASNVELLVDIMVYTGTIISISRYGQKKVGCGPMAKASFEESLENFLKAGLNGEKENANGVSASIMLGKMPNIGTGVFDMMIDIPKLLSSKTYSGTVPQPSQPSQSSPPSQSSSSTTFAPSASPRERSPIKRSPQRVKEEKVEEKKAEKTEEKKEEKVVEKTEEKKEEIEQPKPVAKKFQRF
jgi:DNA-directed RNA polymerase beta' subunit